MVTIEKYGELQTKCHRQAGFLQGCILSSTSWVAVAAGALIAPILPRMAAHFASTPNAEALTTICVTLPALFVALLAVPFGLLADKISQRWLLILTLILYSLFGLMPIGLASLYEILLSRVGVGIAEAAILTVGTALIANFFTGTARERWYAVQSGSAAVVAILFFSIGGALGEISWRAPFLVYSIPIVLALLVFVAIWDPDRITKHQRTSLDSKEPMPWGHIFRSVLVTIFASTAFYVVVIQLPFILSERGFEAPASIGFAAAIAAASTPFGAIAFGRLRHNSAAFKLAISFTLSSIGFLIIASTRGYTEIIVGSVINGVGCGIVLPTVLTWTLSKVPPTWRGRGAGIWNSSFALGQFLSPLMFVTGTNIAGNRATALFYWGLILAVAASLAAISCLPLRKQEQPVKA